VTPSQEFDILEFEGRYAWLSNFYPVKVRLDNIEYPSVEHAYQAAKTFDQSERFKIRTAKSPGTAKKLGKKVTLRPNWNRLRLRVMEDLLRQKFERPDLRELLLTTYPGKLVEGNWWKDMYWGVFCGVGENHLGRLLMKIRDDIRNANETAHPAD
jgi:N-glycosidase YbiA